MKTKYLNIRKNILVLLLIILGVNSMLAQTNKGYEIMKKNDELKEPDDAFFEGNLVIKNKRGNIKKRKMKIFSKKQPAGFDSFFEILEPADVEGMKFLTIAKKGEDEQRIYLPAFGKSRKISGSGKDGKFLGSDIYFYDLEDHNLEDFTYQFIDEKKWEGKDYFIVEAYPIDKKAPYSKIVNWVCKEDYFIYKCEMFDKKQKRHLKTSIINQTQIIQGIILSVEMITQNHIDNSSTIYYQSNFKINVGMDKSIFTIQNLEN